MLGVTTAVTINSEDIGDERHIHCRFYFWFCSTVLKLSIMGTVIDSTGSSQVLLPAWYTKYVYGNNIYGMDPTQSQDH